MQTKSTAHSPTLASHKHTRIHRQGLRYGNTNTQLNGKCKQKAARGAAESATRGWCWDAPTGCHPHIHTHIYIHMYLMMLRQQSVYTYAVYKYEFYICYLLKRCMQQPHNSTLRFPPSAQLCNLHNLWGEQGSRSRRCGRRDRRALYFKAI